jgi:hypothetical protein
MAARGEKLGRDLWITQSGWGLRQKTFFLEEVGFIRLYWVNAKGCCIRPIMDTYVSYVLDFSYRIYIDSNCRNSLI